MVKINAGNVIKKSIIFIYEDITVFLIKTNAALKRSSVSSIILMISSLYMRVINIKIIIKIPILAF